MSVPSSTLSAVTPSVSVPSFSVEQAQSIFYQLTRLLFAIEYCLLQKVPFRFSDEKLNVIRHFLLLFRFPLPNTHKLFYCYLTDKQFVNYTAYIASPEWIRTNHIPHLKKLITHFLTGTAIYSDCICPSPLLHTIQEIPVGTPDDEFTEFLLCIDIPQNPAGQQTPHTARTSRRRTLATTATDPTSDPSLVPSSVDTSEVDSLRISATSARSNLTVELPEDFTTPVSDLDIPSLNNSSDSSSDSDTNQTFSTPSTNDQTLNTNNSPSSPSSPSNLPFSQYSGSLHSLHSSSSSPSSTSNHSSRANSPQLLVMADAQAINNLTDTLRHLKTYNDAKTDLLLLNNKPFSGTALEKSQSAEVWSSFENHVKYQRQLDPNAYNTTAKVLDKFKYILRSAALDWAEHLNLDDIDTDTKLKEAFLSRFNPYGNSQEELDEAWDKLKFNFKVDDVDTFAQDVLLLAQLANKSENQRVKKLRQQLPVTLQLQAIDIHSFEELVALYKKTRHLLNTAIDVTPPSKSSSVYAHTNPYEEVSSKTPAETDIVAQLL